MLRMLIFFPCGNFKNLKKITRSKRTKRGEHPRAGTSRDTAVPKMNEDYITHAHEENEGRATKRCRKDSVGLKQGFKGHF